MAQGSFAFVDTVPAAGSIGGSEPAGGCALQNPPKQTTGLGALMPGGRKHNRGGAAPPSFIGIDDRLGKPIQKAINPPSNEWRKKGTSPPGTSKVATYRSMDLSPTPPTRT